MIHSYHAIARVSAVGRAATPTRAAAPAVGRAACAECARGEDIDLAPARVARLAHGVAVALVALRAVRGAVCGARSERRRHRKTHGRAQRKEDERDNVEPTSHARLNAVQVYVSDE